ncbi:HD domain-containing protein [Aquibacillus kalidii]|uniref:HD domain-containing protein n=1 Tax=Aquibacillus kalidii TaxID=2762597 RepID=UPI001F4809C3|nr:HD domain-containing protein [Aquibacillus kalidii]
MDLLKAITYATEKHDGQRRKVDKIPYISHPYRVSMLLATEGYDKEIVTAGLLHDIVEDTDGTLDEIKSLFGEIVAELVQYASEPDKSLPWEKRKQHTITTIKHAPLAAKIVVCADKVDNLTSIIENEKQLGSKVWNSFKRDKASQQWYYTGIYESLIHGLQEQPPLINQFKKLLDQFNG